MTDSGTRMRRWLLLSLILFAISPPCLAVYVYLAEQVRRSQPTSQRSVEELKAANDALLAAKAAAARVKEEHESR